MKRRRVFSIVLALILFTSILILPATGRAEQPRDRFRGETGVITLGVGQKVVVWMHGGALKGPTRVRFAWQRYMATGCNSDGVCQQVVQSQGTTAPVNLAPNEAASFEVQGNGNGVRVEVRVAAGDVNGDAEIINTATGEVTSHVIMANTEGD
ncbi:MAG TPA: hypothetical protein VN476_11090 [Pyrinomonadaceae bacterium]|nr:hypothetical protein [Pyrinomonadaceae bacterium]